MVPVFVHELSSPLDANDKIIRKNLVGITGDPPGEQMVWRGHIRLASYAVALVVKYVSANQEPSDCSDTKNAKSRLRFSQSNRGSNPRNRHQVGKLPRKTDLKTGCMGLRSTPKRGILVF